MQEHYSYYYSSFPMGKASRIMRKSVFTFLQNFQFFTSAPSLLAVPFAVSALLSQPLVSSSSLFPLVHGRLRSVFLAAGFPPSSELFVILNLKLSQTVLSFLVVFPFTLSFLLLAKASVIRALEHQKTPQRRAFYSWIMIFNPLFITQLCNSLFILSVNATCFCLLVISFNLFDVLGLSSHGPTAAAAISNRSYNLLHHSCQRLHHMQSSIARFGNRKARWVQLNSQGLCSDPGQNRNCAVFSRSNQHGLGCS
ncbi:hypothetical protein Sango_1747500 [Sesamum angolense]|uniref:Uncharacterized protein n=1 Tax=Sesamum angolense TaxID=2727404 RepID=A0AAE1WM29_9LAMI|nr:hypothetical protein Sango_1747500 [Sesamum angolense]